MIRLNSKLFRVVAANCRSNFLKQSSTKATTQKQKNDEVLESYDSSSWSATQSKDSVSDGVETAAAAKSGQLPARQPLAKNFLLGIVDKELLAFPEVIPREDMAILQNEVLPLKNFFAEEVDTLAIDATRQIKPEVMEGVRQLGLYGLTVPYDYDGKDWGWSQSLIASEPEANCTDVALGLLSHRVIIDVLKEKGTIEQQQRFLSKLGSGAFVGIEAAYEYNLPEDYFFNTTAVFNPDTNIWTLSGEKSFVVTGPLPSGSTPLFLVLAQTLRPNMTGDIARGTTIFLVDGSTTGVKLGDQHLTMGCRGLQMRHVKFEDVRVPDSCLMGHAHEGITVADNLLRSARLRNSMIGLGMAKNLLNDLTEYSVHTKQCGVKLTDLELIRTHLSKACCNVYAMESMIYMTAGLLDEFHQQDVALEAAITKYFTLKRLFEMTTEFTNIIGPKSLHAGQTTEVALRNAAQLCTQGETMDTLCMAIALIGLQHAGVQMNDTVQKTRNPLFHPGHIFSKFLNSSTIENPKTKMRLDEKVHLTLGPAAQCIEYSVARLHMCVELLLTRWGGQIVEYHNEMRRLAEMTIAIYAMFASVSRASRSYCIGLQLADHELLIASTIAAHGSEVVKSLCWEIHNGMYVNNDNNLKRLATQVTKSKGYFSVHPLTYNF